MLGEVQCSALPNPMFHSLLRSSWGLPELVGLKIVWQRSVLFSIGATSDCLPPLNLLSPYFLFNTLMNVCEHDRTLNVHQKRGRNGGSLQKNNWAMVAMKMKWHACCISSCRVRVYEELIIVFNGQYVHIHLHRQWTQRIGVPPLAHIDAYADVRQQSWWNCAWPLLTVESWFIMIALHDT